MKTMVKTMAKVVALAAVFQAVQAHAAGVVYLWDGSQGNGDWFDAANWDQNNVPGTTQNGSTTSDQAQIGNVSGTINYTPGTPTSFDTLNITKNDAALLTVNLNGNLTTKHVSGGAYATSGDTIGTAAAANLVFNVNSGTYGIDRHGLSFYGSQFNIAPGASVVTMASGDIPGGNRHFGVSGGTVTIQGSFSNYGAWSGGESSVRDNGLRIGSAQPGGNVIVDGGQVAVDVIYFDQNSAATTPTLTIQNGGRVTLRYGGPGLAIGGGVNGTYNSRVVMTGGTMTNNSILRVGTVNSVGATKDGIGRVTISGGTWNQNGSAYIGDGRQGSVTNSGSAVFNCPADVYVGGGRTSVDTAPSGLSPNGVLTINGGTVTISNPNAGTVFTATTAGRQNPSSITHYFGVAAGTWDKTYLGQRVVLDTLSGTGNGLFVGTTYYAYDINIIAIDSKNNFGLAATSGGAGLTGTASYSGATYHTLGARLLVGNTMTFSGGTTLDIPGTLNLNGGTLTVDELVANMGSGKSTINFNGGTLTTRGTDVNTGAALVAGNGTSDATLNLVGGTHAFANGLVINTNAAFVVGGTNAIGAAASITGDVTFRANAIFDCDFNATTSDWTVVTGTVTLPATATLRARALDSSLRTPIPVLQATSIVGSAAGWSLASINGYNYRVVVSENQLVLEKIPHGTVISIR
jgi:hypothetical protein